MITVINNQSKTESKNKYVSLLLCLVLDAMGMISFTIPLLGEFSDVIWAPIAAFLFKQMFRGKLGTYGSVFTFIEEALPFLDVIPTFTLAWFIQKFNKKEHQKV